MSNPQIKNSPLVTVQLRTLIDLGKSASLINLHKTSIKSKQSGNYLSRIKGRGMEFDEARLYQPGDDIRTIDWRVTARTGNTHTKVFREERERPIFVSVDHRPTMQFATRGVFKSVQAAKIAGLIAWAAQHQGDRIGGQVFTQNLCQEIKPQSGKQGVLHFLNALVHTRSIDYPEMDLENALSRLITHAKPGSQVFIISDFRGINPACELYLSKLSKHCQVSLIQVFDPLESQLPANGRFRFTNMKRDVTVDTNNHDQALKYQQNFRHRMDYLTQITRKMKIVFLQCSTHGNPMDILR